MALKNLLFFTLFMFFVQFLNGKTIDMDKNFKSSQVENNSFASSNQILYQKRHQKDVKFLNYNWIVFRLKACDYELFYLRNIINILTNLKLII
jgi:hypothetical protein